MDPLSTVSTRVTPQTEQADPRQVPNSAGGYTFPVDQVARLRRFLTLGVDGGTYYTNAADLARENAKVVIDLAASDPQALVREIVEISTSGRAPRQNPAIFALAVAASHPDPDMRRVALGALTAVCRTGTHLFLFARYVEQFRGWGPTLVRAVAGWYSRDVADVAYQAVKYRQREGWSHRDLLRLAHPKPLDGEHAVLYDWIAHGTLADELPDSLHLLAGFTAAQTAPPEKVAALVRDHGLSWEMLPDAALGRTEVWEALLDRGMPMTALIRQLPRLTRLGLLNPLGSWCAKVCEQLTDAERLRKARVHPVNVLVALRTYASGHGARGQDAWDPVGRVVDALDTAFYRAFDAVEPTGKRTLLALDVSGSMTSPVSGLPISCREASAALALVTAATEPSYDIVGFTAGADAYRRDPVLTPLVISPRQRLDDVLRTVSNLPFSGTDCSLPMLWALNNGAQVDTYVIFTDNETWAGRMHPHQALRQYRERTGILARLVVVAMTSTGFSIADPTDPGMLDVAGFDSAVPTLVADFSRGLV